MTTPNPLTLTFDPRTIEHLGVRMYSHVPNAVAELVANSYDADATTVKVRIGSNQSITVEDDGHGMSRKEVAEKYLRIGRNRRRAEQSAMTESGQRRVSGKKGLGKLALFGIGRTVEMETTRSGFPEATRITMSYQDLIESKGDYKPIEQPLRLDADKHGTKVVLTDLRRKTPIDSDKLAASLSRLFNYADTNFSLIVVDSGSNEIEVSRERRLGSLEREFTWSFPEQMTDEDSFLADRRASGIIISTTKPLRNTPRGITLYSSGRLVNEPEFFGASESSHAYSYLTGYLDVDFIDDLDDDVIATDRRALVWDSPEMEELRKSLANLLTRIGREWRTKRSEERKNKTLERIGVSTGSWTESIMSTESREAVKTLLDHVSSEELNLTVDQEVTLTKDIQRLAPPYADYVWRRLHPKIKSASRTHYEKGAYHTAIIEAIKAYVALTARLSDLPRNNEQTLFNEAFGDKGVLTVFKRDQGGIEFTEQTVTNINRGQQNLSTGIHAAFRNPISHEEIKALQDSGALTYEDCLDALSILSYLMRRVEGAEKRRRPPK